jgi:type VI secretion system protein ImpE
MKGEGFQRARGLYASGQLRAAIETLNAEVRARPSDGDCRGFLVELLCLDGNLDRADQQLEALSTQDPGASVGVALWRQLIRAERWRQQFFLEGRVPELLAAPEARLQLHLRASVHARAGELTQAAECLAEAENARPHLHGTSGDVRFDDFRDLDDLVSCVLEILTSNGKYYWVPLERVCGLELHKPARPRDLLWRRATIEVEEGPEGEVYLPTIYAPLPSDADERTKLGRATDWRGGDGIPVRGEGLRTFLVGDEARTVLELGALRFER